MGGLQGPLHYITHQFNSTHINAQHSALLWCSSCLAEKPSAKLSTPYPTSSILRCSGKVWKGIFPAHSLQVFFSKSIEITRNLPCTKLECWAHCTQLLDCKQNSRRPSRPSGFCPCRTHLACPVWRQDGPFPETVQSLWKKNALILLISFWLLTPGISQLAEQSLSKSIEWTSSLNCRHVPKIVTTNWIKLVISLTP